MNTIPPNGKKSETSIQGQKTSVSYKVRMHAKYPLRPTVTPGDKVTESSVRHMLKGVQHEAQKQGHIQFIQIFIGAVVVALIIFGIITQL